MTRLARHVAAVAALLFAALAGCSADPEQARSPRELAAGLSWPTLTVHTTPAEAFEATRPIHVTWQPGTFAIWAEAEADLRHRMVVTGRDVFYNQVAGMGWTRFSLDDRVAPNSPRLVLWDLREALAAPSMDLTVNETGNLLTFTATGTLATSQGKLPVRIDLGAVDGRVAWARLESEYAMEAPFTFRDEGTPFPFDPVVPQVSLPYGEATTRNVVANSGHVTVIKLLQEYARNHACTVPDEPSPESMRLELLASGKEWPRNAFTDEPLRTGSGSGDMGWSKKGPSEANYVGWGWDGALVSQTYTAACR